MIKRLGILTGGGDCPGLNAVIRAVTKSAILDFGTKIIGFKDGYTGLVENKFRQLSYTDVSGMLTLGGTILGTSNIANPFRYPRGKGSNIKYSDLSGKAINNFKKLKLDCLIAIGGDGTLNIAYKLFRSGLSNIIGIPKTIDNDVRGTDLASGFHSAVAIATDAIDRLHTTAQSHHRVMVIEVMGRYAGWLALYAGVAGGGDIILIPEIQFDIQKVCQKVIGRNRKGKRFSIIVVAEGAVPKGGTQVIKKIIEESPDPIRLGGIGNVVSSQIEKMTGLETRVTVLGHLQRGGPPSAFDRILATQFGVEAVRLAVNKKFGYIVALKGDKVVPRSLKEAGQGPRKVPKNHPLIGIARSVGTSFGD